MQKTGRFNRLAERIESRSSASLGDPEVRSMFELRFKLSPAGRQSRQLTRFCGKE